jgi:hypothetical protein
MLLCSAIWSSSGQAVYDVKTSEVTDLNLKRKILKFLSTCTFVMKNQLSLLVDHSFTGNEGRGGMIQSNDF